MARGDTFHDTVSLMPKGSRAVAVDYPMKAWGLENSNEYLERAAEDLIKKGYFVDIIYGDSSLRGENVKGWYENIAKEIKQFYNIPVYFRPHPLDKGMHQSIQNTPNLDGSLEESLSKALFTVAWNSNSCFDSIMAGIPCYAGDKGTMAWDLCMKSIENLYYPEREAVCHKIAWTQWSPDEIESGTATRKLADRIRLYES